MKAFRNLVLPAILGVLVLFAWIGTPSSPLHEFSLDATAQQYVDQGMSRALATFATARTINAVLSTMQGTTLAVEPFGIGVQFSVGQALHPLNQLIGQFADWMLAASVAFGVMKVLVTVGSSLALTLALTVVAVAWAVYRGRTGSAPSWLTKALVLLAVLRFVVPVVALGSQWVYVIFLADDYSTSQTALSESAKKVDGQAAASPATTPSASASPDSGPQSSKSNLDIIIDWATSKLPHSTIANAKPEPGMLEKWKGEASSKITSLANAAEALTEHVVKLIVVFLLQTLVIPMVLLWAVLRGVATLSRGIR